MGKTHCMLEEAKDHMTSNSCTDIWARPLTSSKSQYVLDSPCLGLLQVTCDDLLGLVGTGDVEHGIQATVVQCCAGNRHGAGLRLPTWVTSWMPGDITE